MSVTCDICKQEFKSKRFLDKHKGNKIPCNFKCTICDTTLSSRRNYTRHMETEHSNKNQPQITNINNTQNNQNNQNNQLVDVKNNVVMLHPLGLTHHYMNRHEVISPVKNMLVKMVRAKKFALAYETLFKQIHGNPDIPEHHNVYAKDINKDQICVFNGAYFEVHFKDMIIPDMYRILKEEMKWAVNETDLDAEEKDQLMWDIQKNWMHTDVDKDTNMHRIIVNNRPVVEDTFNTKTVYRNLEYIAKSKKLKLKNVTSRNKDPLKLQ